VDYSGLDGSLPPILGYESKWLPDSPYWTQIRFKETTLPASIQRNLVEYASRLFERLRCRDYARVRFQSQCGGGNQAPGSQSQSGLVLDGKMNLMAGMAGLRYSEFLGLVLEARRAVCAMCWRRASRPPMEKAAQVA